MPHLKNGHIAPISQIGQGLHSLTCKLPLLLLHNISNLAYNIPSIHKLTFDRPCTIPFIASSYKIKGLMTNLKLFKGPHLDYLIALELRYIHCFYSVWLPSLSL